jgi:hypothetical protein
MDTADPGACDFDATATSRGWSSSRGTGHGLLLKFRNETPAAGYGSFSAGAAYFPDRSPELVVTYASRA